MTARPAKPTKARKPVRKATRGPAAAARERARERLPQPRSRSVAATERTEPPKRLKDRSDDELATMYSQAILAGDDRLADQITAELDARDAQDDDWGSQDDTAALLDRLSGKPQQTPREQAKEAYEDYVLALYVRAVEATNAAMVNAAGKAANIDEMDLLRGRMNRQQVAKYASEELLRWLAEPGNERMTETEFIQAWLGESAAQNAKRRRPLSEF